MKYFALAAAFAVSASALNSYEEYVAEDERPVCGKHYDENKNRLCNLFLSCHFDKFQSGITGEKWCPQACANFLECFPRQMCKDDHWNQANALKWEINEDANEVCYTKNPTVGRQCVAVQGFCDMGAPAPNPAEQIAIAGATPCNDPGCVGITLMWNNEGDVRNDLDIYVDGPEGTIYYGRTSVGSGYLDTDAGQGTMSAVENVAWTTGAPRGSYTVRVDNYSQSGSGAKDYTVAVRTDGGAFEIFQGSISSSRGDMDVITSFTY